MKCVSEKTFCLICEKGNGRGQDRKTDLFRGKLAPLLTYRMWSMKKIKKDPEIFANNFMILKRE